MKKIYVLFILICGLMTNEVIAQTIHVTASYGKAILCEDNVLHFEVSVDNSHAVSSSQGNFFLALNLGTSATGSSPTNYQTVTPSSSMNGPQWAVFDLGTTTISDTTISVDIHLAISCEARQGLNSGTMSNALTITDQIQILRGNDTTHQVADSSWDMVVHQHGPPNPTTYSSKQISLSVYYAYFGESDQDMSLNYYDVYSAEHFGQHVTRSFLFTDLGPDVGDTSKRYEGVFTFGDQYNCTEDTVYIPLINVITGTDTTLYVNANGALSNIFSYGEIPYSIRHGESIKIIESLVFPNY